MRETAAPPSPEGEEGSATWLGAGTPLAWSRQDPVPFGISPLATDPPSLLPEGRGQPSIPSGRDPNPFRARSLGIGAGP
jgi:hypothetical protein